MNNDEKERRNSETFWKRVKKPMKTDEQERKSKKNDEKEWKNNETLWKMKKKQWKMI